MKVRAVSRMGNEDFMRHLNARHAADEELGGLREIPLSFLRTEKDRTTWEAYHRRLHEYRSYDHEHGSD